MGEIETVAAIAVSDSRANFCPAQRLLSMDNVRNRRQLDSNCHTTARGLKYQNEKSIAIKPAR